MTRCREAGRGILALAAILAVTLAVSLGFPATEARAAQDDPRSALLVDAEWLEAHLDDPGLVVLHVGRNYDDGHVPGAVPLDLGAITFSRGERDDPDHVMLELPPELATARRAFEAAGVSDASTVVFVFEGRGMPNATRALWTLQVLGKDDARLLDGGMEAWIAAGGAVTTENSTPAPGRITAEARLDRRVEKDFVQARGTAPGVALVDARRPGHYSGADEEIDGRAGHIPGAGSLFFGELLTDDGRLKPTDELRDLFAAAGVVDGDQVVAYCHIGLWGSGVLFAARTLGFDAVLYDGSMSEWARDRELPLEGGAGGR